MLAVGVQSGIIVKLEDIDSPKHLRGLEINRAAATSCWLFQWMSRAKTWERQWVPRNRIRQQHRGPAQATWFWSIDERFIFSTWSFSLKWVGIRDTGRKMESFVDLRLKHSRCFFRLSALRNHYKANKTILWVRIFNRQRTANCRRWYEILNVLRNKPTDQYVIIPHTCPGW